jgi:formamidopyrimidine-DNA glycosylase
VPELPEVETIRRSLAPFIEGRRIARLEVFDPRWCRPVSPAEFSDAVEGRVVEQLGRRGKYLVFGLSGDLFLVCHLRMTGNFLYDAPEGTPYQRAVFALDDGHRLRYCDVRRFGTADLLAGASSLDGFFASRLGIEPLGGGLDGSMLKDLAQGRTVPVKSFLLDQRMVAGIGNIYADEALYRARIHPLRPVGRLCPGQYDDLSQAISGALAAGLEAGGATIDDFRHPDGLYGSFQDEFQVHRRAGEPCGRCGREIRKLTVGGRGTYVCEVCQPRPRLRVRR